MSDDDPTYDEFEEAIERLLRRFRGRLDPCRAAAALSAAADALTHQPEAAGITFDSVTSTLHVVFEEPAELRDRLSDFCDLRALVVEAEVPMHQDVVVRVSASGRAVELMGRVVQELPSGRCIQIDRLDDVTETRLRALPDQMSSGDGPDTGDFARPQTGGRIPVETPVRKADHDLFGGLSESSDADLFGGSSATDDDLFGGVSQQSDRGGFVRQPTLADHRPPVSPSRSWSVEPTSETTLSDMLLALVANNATGLLELVGQERRLVLVDRGQIVDVGSEPEQPDESLEALLMRSKTIDADDVDKVRAYRSKFGVGSSEAILNLGLVDWNDLQIGLRTRIRYLLRDVWSFRGDAHFFPLEDLPSKPLAKPVRILNVVFGHRAEVLEKDDLDGSVRDFLLRPPSSLPPVLATVELLPQHEDILSINFASGKGAEELVRLSRSGRGEALAAIETLVALGFLETVERRPLSRVQTNSVRQVDVLYARLDTKSHFEVFGLHWSAYDDEVKKRYRELTAKFDPKRFDDVLDDELERRLNQVSERVEAAWKVLRDRTRRREHRAELIDSFQIENSVHMFESQADTAMFRREIDEAIGFVSRIIELQPHRRDMETKLKQLKELA